MEHRSGGWGVVAVWDIAVAAVLTVLTAALSVQPTLLSPTVRLGIVLPFVLFVPGHALVSALFPHRASQGRHDGAGAAGRSSGGGSAARSLTGAERVGFSVGLSVAVVGLCGLVLSSLGAGVGLVTVVAAVAGLSGIALGLAAIRRYTAGPTGRYVPRPVIPRLTDPAQERRLSAWTSRGLTAMLVVVALVTVGGLAFGLPGGGKTGYTELYILSEEPDGELGTDYPVNLSVGEPEQLVVGVENHERDRTYVVRVELQRLEERNGSRVVTERVRQATLQTRVAEGATVRETVEILPDRQGSDFRVAVLLYRGALDGGRVLTTGEPYRAVHLNVNVTGSG